MDMIELMGWDALRQSGAQLTRPSHPPDTIPFIPFIHPNSHPS